MLHHSATSQAPGHHRSRTGKLVLGVAGVLVAIPVIALIVLLTFDWNRVRPWLNDKVSAAIDRPFAIRGNLAVHWEQPARAMAPSNRTWRDWIPWPHLYADDVHLGNPAAMPRGDMASVGRFSFSLNPFPLLSHTISLPVLRLDAPKVDLLRTAPGHDNWTFQHEQKPSKWRLDLRRIVLARGVLHLDDAVTGTSITARVDTLAHDPTYGIGWTVSGSYNGAPVTGGGKAGAVLSLENQAAPFPIEADMHSGPNQIVLKGTITRPAQLEAIDLHLKLGAASMARLYPFTHVVLPETPQFTTEGHLVGKLGPASSHWSYHDFKGKVGASDISGNLELQTGKPRPRLSARVVSHALLFSDLGPLVGADSNAAKTRRGVAPVQPKGKKLPTERFRTERWKAMDADVHFRGDRVIRNKNLPINDLSAHLVLKDGVLTLDPLDFGFAGGHLKSNIRLDASSGDKIKASASVAARRLQIKQMFPAVQNIRQATIGELNGDARLSAVGDSVASMLAASNGELKTLVEQGTVSKLLLEEMGLNIGSIVVTKLFGDKTVQLNCMATDFDIDNGVLKTQTFVADTDEARVTVKGTVNLGTETMDLTLDPQTKGVHLFSLRSPLYLRGTFAHPDVGVDKKVLALKAGSAIVLGAIAAPAALIPLINTGPGKASNCARLLTLATTKPKAPPPGETGKR